MDTSRLGTGKYQNTPVGFARSANSGLSIRRRERGWGRGEVRRRRERPKAEPFGAGTVERRGSPGPGKGSWSEERQGQTGFFCSAEGPCVRLAWYRWVLSVVRKGGEAVMALEPLRWALVSTALYHHSAGTLRTGQDLRVSWGCMGWCGFCLLPWGL